MDTVHEVNNTKINENQQISRISKYTVTHKNKLFFSVVKLGCTTGLTSGWMFVYTMQPVVKAVVQPVVSCKRGFINNRSTTTGDYRSAVTDTE